MRIKLCGNKFSFTKEKLKKAIVRVREALSGKIILRRRRNRSIQNLMSFLSSCRGIPDLFLSLVADRNRRLYVNAKEEKKILKEFFKLVYKQYPQYAAVYKCEWHHGRKIHFHVVLFLNLENGSAADSVHRRRLSSFWRLVNKGLIKSGDYHQTPCIPERHYSYLAKPSKANEDMKCLEELGRDTLWGCINTKKIDKYPDIELNFVGDEGIIFQECIDIYFEINTCAKKSRRILKRTAGTINGVPHWVLQEAIIVARLHNSLEENSHLYHTWILNGKVKQIETIYDFETMLSKKQQSLVIDIISGITEKNKTFVLPLRQPLSICDVWQHTPYEVIRAAIAICYSYSAIVNNQNPKEAF